MLMKPTTEKEERRRITCHSYLSSQLHEKLLGSFRPSCVHDSCQFLSEFESIQIFQVSEKLTIDYVLFEDWCGSYMLVQNYLIISQS